MNKWKKIGFISVEVVITAAIVLAAGLFGIGSLSSNGRSSMQTAMNKLDGLGVFGAANPEVPVDENLVVIPATVYDANGYPAELNIASGDINIEEDFTYIWDAINNGWAVASYLGTDTTVVVPATRLSDGLPVVALADDSLKYNWGPTRLTSLALPKGIVKIGYGAFAYQRLTSLVIPDTVTMILDNAFANNLLTNVVIPNSVTYLGPWSFSDNKMTTATIGNNVTNIGYSAFRNNLLTTIKLGSKVATIGNDAFKNNELISLSLPNSVTTLGDQAFEDNKLTTIKFGTGLTDTGYYTFNSNSFTTLTLPVGITKIGEGSFAYCYDMTSVTIPATVTNIGSDAFTYNGLTSVNFKGPLPSTLGTYILYGTELSTGGIEVPSAYLSNYQAAATAFGVASDRFVGK